MGISGNIKTMVLSELLQWLSQGQKTGTLVIDGNKVKKRIFFEDGVIVSSASTDPNEYLGHFLTSHGYITEEEANSAVSRQKEEKQLLGQILVSMGVITKEQLQEVLQLKAEESIYDIFTWGEGDFVFLDNDLPAETFIRMNLDVQWIVLEGSRRMDDWQRIREWVPSKQAVPVLVVDYESMEIDEVDKRILAWIDDDRTVEEISQGAQTSVYMISDTLSQYVQQGVIKVVRPRIIEVEVPAKDSDDESSSESGQQPQQQQQQQQMQQMQQQMQQMQQMMPQGYPQGFPQMMPGQMPQGYPQGYPGVPQGYPVQMPGYDPPSGAIPYQTQQGSMPPGGGAVSVGDRTLHFAGGGGGGAAPAAPAPPPQPKSEAEALLFKGDDLLSSGQLKEALESYRQAKTAEGTGPSIEQAMQEGEKKVLEALERDGVKLSSVPKLKCGMEELTQLDISPQEGFMLTRIDGSYDIQSILKMSPMPKVDAQMLFWKLKKTGHVSI